MSNGENFIEEYSKKVLKEDANPEFEGIKRDMDQKTYSDSRKYSADLYVDAEKKRIEVSIASVGSKSIQDVENRIHGILQIINIAKEYEKKFNKIGWKRWS